MTKVVLNDIVSLENQTSVVNTINANNAVIETAFDNTLSRDGSTPNQMEATLDMNSNRIINLPAPISNDEPLRLIDGLASGGIQGPPGEQGPIGPAGNGLLNNLINNSGLGLCTNISSVIVDTGVQALVFAQVGGAGSGCVQFTTTGGNRGLTPGKLVAVMGNNIADISFTATVTGGNTITATTPVFSQSPGDLFWVRGGSNGSPRTQYRVASSTTTVLTVNGGLANESNVTFTGRAIQGGYAIDPTVNGMPQAGKAEAPAFYYYPLQVTSVGTDFVNCAMAGRDINVGTSSACKLYEITNGCQETGFIGPDWWYGTGNVSYYRMRQYDWDGTTVVNMPGSLYSGKIVKGLTTPETVYTNLAAQTPTSIDQPNIATTANFQGKTITFGAYAWAPNTGQGRIFIDDGVSVTYSSYVPIGSYQWAEVTKTLSNSATKANVGVYLGAGAKGDTFFFTQPMAVYGPITIGAGNYRPMPASLKMFKGHTNPFYLIGAAVPSSCYINIEQETCGCIPSGLHAVQADIGGNNSVINNAYIYLGDTNGIGTSQMSAIVALNQNLTNETLDTGVVGIAQRPAGDGSGFYIDSNFIAVSDAHWANVTVDYLGGVYS